MIRKTNRAFFIIILFGLHLHSPSFAASATMKLVYDLETNWNKSEMLDFSCKKGSELNSNVLSFFNPFIGASRVRAFSNNKEVMSSYMSKEEMQDEDTISAFADAMEAALLRAMRKRCPDVW